MIAHTVSQDAARYEPHSCACAKGIPWRPNGHVKDTTSVMEHRLAPSRHASCGHAVRDLDLTKRRPGTAFAVQFVILRSRTYGPLAAARFKVQSSSRDHTTLPGHNVLCASPTKETRLMYSIVADGRWLASTSKE